jgi:hypothetical protein
MNEDGMWLVATMAEVLKKFDLKLVSIEDLAYRMQHDSLIMKITTLETATVILL